MLTEGIAEYGGVAIASLSLFLSFVVFARQSRMQLEALRLQVDAAVTGWANLCIHEMSRAIEFCEHSANDDKLRGDLRWRLSALIDQGRLYFPNSKSDDRSPSIWRNTGHRPAILDAVAFSYFVVRDFENVQKSPSEVVEFLKQCRRLLYTEMQHALAPKKRIKLLQRLDSRKNNQFQDALAARMNEILPGSLKRFSASTPKSE